MRIVLLFISFALLYSCNGKTSINDEKLEAYGRVSEDSLTTNRVSMDSLWHELVFINGGCLVGGQHVKNGKFGNEECVMTDFRRRGKKWLVFYSNFSKAEQTNFLLSQLADTSATKIHTCPCFIAANGEVAVYALQYIFRKNWYDLEGFEEYATSEGTDCTNNEQAWLLEILTKKKKRDNLKAAWERELNP